MNKNIIAITLLVVIMFYTDSSRAAELTTDSNEYIVLVTERHTKIQVLGLSKPKYRTKAQNYIAEIGDIYNQASAWITYLHPNDTELNNISFKYVREHLVQGRMVRPSCAKGIRTRDTVITPVRYHMFNRYSGIVIFGALVRKNDLYTYYPLVMYPEDTSILRGACRVLRESMDDIDL